MLTVDRIAKLISAQRWSTLLDELLRNGRPLPLLARARLHDSANEPLCALGLGLQRAVELAYAPSDALLLIADRLASALGTTACALGASARDAAQPPSTVAIAVGARALADLLDGARERGWAIAHSPVGERAAGALAHAAHQLHAAQVHTGASGRDRGLVGDLLDSALVLWQLAGRGGAAARVDPPVDLRALDRALDRRGAWRDRDCAIVLELAHAHAGNAPWAALPCRKAA